MNTVLFDLDGTLLPMDQDLFVRVYLKQLSLKGKSMGYEPDRLIKTVMSGVEAMQANDGSLTNEQLFWSLFLAEFGGNVDRHIAEFESFYRNEFRRVAQVVQPGAWANQAVQLLREKGYAVVLATNPIFPKIAVLERMRWAGLKPGDFTLITTYEDCRFTKPNLDYYRGILEALVLKGENCLMVGNDVEEDLCAAQLGMEIFLITDNMININDADISRFPRGDSADLLRLLRQLPVLD